MRTYKIKPGSAPYYIGKGGKKIKEMQESYKVNIQIPPGENRIVIKGSLQGIEDTERELRNVTENLETQRERRALEVCYYYKKGLCWNGDKCEFSHEQEDRNKRRSRSRSQIRTYADNKRSHSRNETQAHSSRSYARTAENYDRSRGRDRSGRE